MYLGYIIASLSLFLQGSCLNTWPFGKPELGNCQGSHLRAKYKMSWARGLTFGCLLPFVSLLVLLSLSLLFQLPLLWVQLMFICALPPKRTRSSLDSPDGWSGDQEPDGDKRKKGKATCVCILFDWVKPFAPRGRKQSHLLTLIECSSRSLEEKEKESLGHERSIEMCGKNI